MKLIKPTKDMRETFLEMAHEWRDGGDDRYAEATVDFEAYVDKLTAHSRGEGLRPDRVPQTTYWLIEGGRVLATANLRHRLLPHLEERGGHIGYNVRPSQRGKGVGTRLLAETLVKARQMGLPKVLVTCAEDNVASARVMEKNRGVFSRRSYPEELKGKAELLYWIETGDVEQEESTVPSEAATSAPSDVR